MVVRARQFTAALRSVTSHEDLDREVLRSRLLCLLGIGAIAIVTDGTREDAGVSITRSL